MTRAPSSGPRAAARDPFTAPIRRDRPAPFWGAAFAAGREVAPRIHAVRWEET